MRRTVDDYIAKLPFAQRRIARDLRSAIMRGGPLLVETIKWARPVYLASKPVCYFRAYTSYVTFGLWPGVELMTLTERLVTTGSKMAHLKIVSRDDVDETLIQQLVAAAVELDKV